MGGVGRDAGGTRVVGALGAGAGDEMISDPMGAKGFGLPSLPSGTSTILESRRVKKAGSEKIESSNLILLMFKSRERKSRARAELASE